MRSMTLISCSMRMMVSPGMRRLTSSRSSIKRCVSSSVMPAEGSSSSSRRGRLISRPRLLLLDEPSAGMTLEETQRLMDDLLLVKRRMPGLTIILIEHEMSVIERITERCVVLNYGRKIAEGTYAEVARDPQVRQAYLGLE